MSTNPTQRWTDLRDWRKRLGSELGLDLDAVISIDDIPEEPWMKVSWKAATEQTASAGLPGHSTWEYDGAQAAPWVNQYVLLRDDEWTAILAAIGPKPELFTPDEQAALYRLSRLK